MPQHPGIDDRTTVHQPQPLPDQQIPHFWVMTIKTADGRQCTYDGTVALAPGSEKYAAYRDMKQYVAQQVHTDLFTVLFFDLSPNRI